jgi:hypothetical protein
VFAAGGDVDLDIPTGRVVGLSKDGVRDAISIPVSHEAGAIIFVDEGRGKLRGPVSESYPRRSRPGFPFSLSESNRGIDRTASRCNV